MNDNNIEQQVSEFELEYDPLSGLSGVILPISGICVQHNLDIQTSMIDGKLLAIIDESCRMATQLKLSTISESLFLVALWNKQRDYVQSLFDECDVDRNEFLSTLANNVTNEEHANVFTNDMSQDLKNDFNNSFMIAERRSGKILISDILCQMANANSIAGIQFRRHRISEEKIREISLY